MQNIHTEIWEGFPGENQIKRVGSRAGNPPQAPEEPQLGSEPVAGCTQKPAQDF